MPDFSFLSQGTSFRLPNNRKTIKWLEKIAQREGRSIDALTYIFATDRLVSRLNREYLRHNTLTDILTFDYSEGRQIAGEIYISIPRVRENAKLFGQSFEMELRRVMAHGLLHLIGYTDKTPLQKRQMRRKEEACLSLWLSST